MTTPPMNPNDAHDAELGMLDRAALAVTTFVGSPWFFLLILGWSVAWLVWNIVAPAGVRFDPAPAFVLWLFISNAIQILLMPLIMIGQNIQARHSELRADATFEMATKMETALEHLEALREAS